MRAFSPMTRMKAAKFCAVFSHGEQGRAAPDLKIVVVAAVGSRWILMPVSCWIAYSASLMRALIARIRPEN
jgi:hypothetical protein